MIAKLLVVVSAMLAMANATSLQFGKPSSPIAEIQMFGDADCTMPMGDKMRSSMPFSAECQQFPITAMKMSTHINCAKKDGQIDFTYKMYSNSLTCDLQNGGQLMMKIETNAPEGACVKTEMPALMPKGTPAVYSRVMCDFEASDAAVKAIEQRKNNKNAIVFG